MSLDGAEVGGGGGGGGTAARWDDILWDPKLALDLIGKRLLVGITELAADGTVLERRQFHGHAIRADRRAGVTVRLNGARSGEEIVLPPDTRAFRPAVRGEYSLRQTGEVVVNPDFLTTWSYRQGDDRQNR